MSGRPIAELILRDLGYLWGLYAIVGFVQSSWVCGREKYPVIIGAHSIDHRDDACGGITLQSEKHQTSDKKCPTRARILAQGARRLQLIRRV